MGAVMSSIEQALDPRVGDRTIHGEGTPERAWRDWQGLATLQPIALAQLAPRDARVVVVAPHPDDEVLGCGGALAMLARAGREIVVVGITDGEGSHAGSMAWTPRSLAFERRRERAEGLARLGLHTPARALGVPDGDIGPQQASLAARLGKLLKPHDTVMVTWRLDGHPDHEAAGRAVAEVVAACGCRMWELPVWMWHWAAPDDPRVPWHRMRRLSLDADACERKSRAIAAHASQLAAMPAERRAPVLPDWALARLMRPFEVFIEPERRP